MDIYNNPIILEALGKETGYFLYHNSNNVELKNNQLGETVVFVVEPRVNFVALACQGEQKGKYLSHANGNLSLQDGMKGDNELWILHEFKNNTIAFECIGNEKGKYLSHADGKLSLQNGNQDDSEKWVYSFVSNYQKYLKAYFDKGANCIAQLHSQFPTKGTVLTAQPNITDNTLLEYFIGSQIFNTRLQQNPLAIVYCKTADDVKAAYRIATANQIPIRVRAGGHDHEGESSGTNVVVIDVSKMTNISVDKNTMIATIGAGNRFNRLTPALAEQDVMIAHGTCATVCVTGFTLGGGWGPWTRKYGMNCEHLVSATMVLGNGEVIELEADPVSSSPDFKEKVDALLWALRGGGGMSYGIVTELRIKTFTLPKELIKFEIQWNPYDKCNEYPTGEYPTLNILKEWETAILSDKTSQLIGTNLKINARPAMDNMDNFDYQNVVHNCVMYGYWEGTREELNHFKADYFSEPDAVLSIDGEGGTNPKMQYSEGKLMSHWDRESFAKVLTAIQENQGLDRGVPIPPDGDQPAPHKITSRLVNPDGLKDEGKGGGYKELLLSLTSPLVRKENRGMGLFTYVTLGAIVGDFYRNFKEIGANNHSAFPYKDKRYTIQYQTWWNEADTDNQYHDPSQNEKIYNNTNLAMDWIDTARNFDIPNTSGAFISFKDNNIPTSVYFDNNYERLREIKERYANDEFNHLRTRKTIV